MFTRQFWSGFGIAAVLVGGLSIWMIAKMETDIIFPPKSFYADQRYATFAGSIVHKNRGTMNGTMTGECIRDDGFCRILTLEQTGPNQVSQIWSDTAYIRQWDENVLVADTKGANVKQCMYYEIRANLPTEDITYSVISQRYDRTCPDYEPKVFKFEIDDSYGWQKLTKRSPK